MPIETAKQTKLRVFLVEDHPLVRKGIADCICDETDMMVCGQAANSIEALAGIAREKPDLVLVDISIPGRDGIELTKEIKAAHRHVYVLVLSIHDESLYAQRALRAGASGYMMKSAPAIELIKAIRDVCAGKTSVSDRIRDQLFQIALSNNSKTERTPLERLTDREIEVLRLYGEGQPRGQIASKLNLSIKTVESHRANICHKLSLNSSIEFMRFSIEFIRDETNAPPPLTPRSQNKK